MARNHRFERKEGILLRAFVRALKASGPPLVARRRRRIHRAGLAFERRGQHVDDGGQRVGTLAGGEPHHRQHDHDAQGRRRGRAESGVHQVHVFEQRGDLRGDGHLPFRFHLVDDGGGERGGFFIAQSRPRVRDALQSEVDAAHVGERLSARVAPLEV